MSVQLDERSAHLHHAAATVDLHAGRSGHVDVALRLDRDVGAALDARCRRCRSAASPCPCSESVISLLVSLSDTLRLPSLVISAMPDFESSSRKTSLWPLRDTTPRRLTLPPSTSPSPRLGVSLPLCSGAEDEDAPEITELARAQHLVIDLGNELDTAVRPRTDRGHARPVALVLVGEPRELQLDAAEMLRVVVVGDHAMKTPGTGGAPPAARPLVAPSDVNPSVERSCMPLISNSVR